jgi:hypothetical protein
LGYGYGYGEQEIETSLCFAYQERLLYEERLFVGRHF